jgi:glutathione synthase/RimK-type ligase-like ATP-grasp enzyme
MHNAFFAPPFPLSNPLPPNDDQGARPVPVPVPLLDAFPEGNHSLAMGQDLLHRGETTEAMAALRQAADVMPLNAEIYRLLALALHAQGNESEAVATGMAALALQQGSAVSLFNIGTAYFMHRHWTPAAQWYRLALMLDPDLVPANQNMAALLQQEGRLAEANMLYDRAYRRQSLFVEPAAIAVRNILILCASRPGNVPFDFLLPLDCNTRIKWVIEYAEQADSEATASTGSVDRARERRAPALPHFDLVFNAIGDADTARRSRAAVDRFLVRNDKPVLNPPAAIECTSRDRIAALLSGIEGICVPRTVRWQAGAAVEEDARTAALCTYPVISRPAGAHGGDGVHLWQSPQPLAEALHAIASASDMGAELYLSHFHDYRSDDGYYRKYRVIFVDRQPYPYHLAISSQWLVHYVTADMLSAPWKTREEFRFLNDPAQSLGAAAWQALEVIAQRLNLDFCGIDFSILPDGRLLVFEANATMLVHPEEHHVSLKFKNWHVQNILNAFNRLMDRRMEIDLP